MTYFNLCAVFVCLYVRLSWSCCVGGCVLSVGIARGYDLRGGCYLLGLASSRVLPRVLPKRFMRMHISGSPAAFLHHPVSVGCISETAGRL